MPGVTVKIEGAEAIARSLKELPNKVSKGIMRKALRAGAKIVLAKARANAPKRTGALARSLKVRAGKTKRGKISIVVQSKEGDFKGDQFYGAIVELGRKSGSRRQRTGRKQIKGKFFLHAAYKETKDAAANAVAETAVAEIEKEAFKT